MKAAFLVDRNKFEVRETPTPVIGNDEALLLVAAVGFCGSDLHDALNAPVAPRTPGHEFAGTIVEIRGNGEGFKKGDLAVIDPIMRCGKCGPCRAGQDHLCETMAVIGCQTPGGFANYVKVPNKNLRRIPAGLPVESATLADPLAVVLHACDLAGDLKGKNVIVLGAGTLGQLMAQVLKLRGAAKVAISDIAQERLDIAAKLGADLTVNAAKDKDYSAVKGISFDVAVELAGAKPTLMQAVNLVRKGGTVLMIAQRPPTEIDCGAVLFSERRLQGVFGMTAANFHQSLDLLGSGKINSRPLVTDIFTLDQMQTAFDKARSTGSVKVVINPN